MEFEFCDKSNNTITFEKIWADEYCFEIMMRVESKYASVWQTCYLGDQNIDELSEFLIDFCNGKGKTDYYESGKKTGNYGPVFSFRLLHDGKGHITVETDIEINDVDDRSHRCICNVYTEIGLLEKFGADIRKLKSGEIGTIVSLSNI